MAVLKDVAKIAGVSTATVSRVLNDAESVNPLTRAKVEKTIKELNFKPSRVAQRLRIRDGKKRIIGLVVPDIQNPFYVDVVRGVEELASLKDYAVFVGNFAQEEEKEKMYLNLMKSESVDGLIVAPSNEKDDEVMKLVKEGLPIVCVDRGLSEMDVDVVLVDNMKGAFDAVEFLIQSGYKRIAYIGGLPQIPTTIHRQNGYEDALKKYGIPIDSELIRFGDSKHESGKIITEELLNLQNRPTALFTGNNLITLGALETIHNRKLKIPQDIAIIGFDDMYWSISLNPPLTAVRQPGYEIGKRAAEILFQKVKEPDRKPVKLILRTELIKRESC